MPVSITASKFPTFEECASSATCISPAPSQGFRRCRNPINWGARATAARIRQSILSFITIPENSIQDAQLRDYAQLSCCIRYHRRQVEDEIVMTELVSRWRNELTEQKRHYTLSMRRTTESRRPSPQTGYATQANSTARTSRNAYRNAQAAVATPRFEVYDPTPSILLTISRRLTAHDLDGRQRSLYCASRTSDPGFYNISYHRSVSLFRRLEKIQNCSGAGNTAKLDFSIQTSHAHRARALLYKELEQNRRQELTCQNPQCTREHRDWFEINLNKAKRIMGRWANWMDHAQPYDDQGQLRSLWKRYCQALDAEGTPITSQRLYRAWVDGLVGDEDSDEDESTDESSSDEDSTDERGSSVGGEREPEENNCPICFDAMMNPARTTCGHEYCADCIAEAFRRDNRCPLCRAELVDGIVGADHVAEIPMQNNIHVR